MQLYILVSVEILCIRASIRQENQYDDFVSVMQDSTACFHLFRFYINFIQQPQFGSSRISSISDALSLELASLGDSRCGRYYVHEISIIFFQFDRGHSGKHTVQLEYAYLNSIFLIYVISTVADKWIVSHRCNWNAHWNYSLIVRQLDSPTVPQYDSRIVHQL